MLSTQQSRRNKQQATSNEQQATGNNQRAKSNKQQVTRITHQAASSKQQAASNRQQARYDNDNTQQCLHMPIAHCAWCLLGNGDVRGGDSPSPPLFELRVLCSKNLRSMCDVILLLYMLFALCITNYALCYLLCVTV